MKKFIFLSIIISTLSLSGCASKVYKSEAFQTKGQFALVQVTGQTSGFGLGTKEDKKLLTTLSSVIYKEFKSTKHFRLISPNTVKKNRTYRRLKTDTSEGLLSLKTAKGYKKFDPRDHKKDMTRLFKELKVNAIISVSAGYHKVNSGFTLSGLLPIPVPVSAGKANGKLTLSIVATDKNNQIIWQDIIEKETEGVGQFMGISNFNKLYPQLIDISKLAAREAVTNLNKNITIARK